MHLAMKALRQANRHGRPQASCTTIRWINRHESPQMYVNCKCVCNQDGPACLLIGCLHA